jgi:Protein of unknown function (DUF664)
MLLAEWRTLPDCGVQLLSGSQQRVVGEYARHNGHAGLIREVIDGSADL